MEIVLLQTQFPDLYQPTIVLADAEGLCQGPWHLRVHHQVVLHRRQSQSPRNEGDCGLVVYGLQLRSLRLKSLIDNGVG